MSQIRCRFSGKSRHAGLGAKVRWALLTCWLALVCLLFHSAAPTVQAQNLFNLFGGRGGEKSSAPSGTDVQVLLFSQERCDPCKQIAPTIDHLIGQGYPIKKIDARANLELAQQWSVTETPTLVVVADGREVSRVSGIVTAHQVGRMLIEAGYNADLSVLTKPTGLTPLRNLMGQFKTGRRGHRGESDPNDPNASIAPAEWSEAEAKAMAATVRIRVQYREGSDLITDFGTGTVIHRHNDDILILTCGHVFRESQGNAEILIDLGFDGGDSKATVPGQLIRFDSHAPDVALIAARSTLDFPAVELGLPDYQPAAGARVFTVGCDQGQPATVRRGHYLSSSMCSEPVSAGETAAGPPAMKYDVSGQPVVGRSGGGLFSQDGKLIGVCNAAVMDQNQGVYSALVNAYQLLAESELEHLFQEESLVQVASFQSEDMQEVPESPKSRRFLPALDLLGIEMPMDSLEAIATANLRSSDEPELIPIHRLPASAGSGPTMRGQSYR